jgi:short chain dehydrogenase
MTTAPHVRRSPAPPTRALRGPARAGRSPSRAGPARRGFTARRALEGRVAVVTGAGRTSAAVAAALAAKGASVVLGASDQLAIARVARQIEGAGGRALAVATDLRDPESVARLAGEALRAFGRLDIAVNGPGRPRGPDERAEPDCRAVYVAVRSQLPAIAASGGGVIVNVALGPLGWSDDARCVVGLTRASAIEQGDSGVRVNALARSPGSDGFADAVAWLCSDAARDLNGAVVTGAEREPREPRRPPESPEAA